MLLRLTPERLSCFFGILIGRLAFLFLKKRSRVAMDNVKRIRPGIPEDEVRATVRRCFEKLGINFIETLLFPYLEKDEYEARFRLEMRGDVEKALATGRGALALGFHYGNWEITGITSFLLKRKIVALARPLKGHTRLNDFLNGLREATGRPLISDARPVSDR